MENEELRKEDLNQVAGGALGNMPASAAEEESEMEDLSSSIMARIGLRPVWRKRGDGSELLFRIPLPGLRPEYVMLGCIVLALGAGLAGGWLPEGVKAGATEYGLAFLADRLGLLNRETLQRKS